MLGHCSAAHVIVAVLSVAVFLIGYEGTKLLWRWVWRRMND